MTTGWLWRVVYEQRAWAGAPWEERIEQCRSEEAARRFIRRTKSRNERAHRIEVTNVDWRPFDHLV